ATTIEARVRKRHRVIQRALATRSASESWQQRATVFSARTQIDETVFRREGTADWNSIESFDLARRFDSETPKGASRATESVQLRSKESQERWNYHRRCRRRNLPRRGGVRAALGRG